METPKYALVLTGELLSGFNADSAWPKLAEQFRMDMDRLRGEVLDHAPLTVKESEDLAGLKSMLSVIKNIGAEAEIHPVDAGRNLFALIDNKPRGPLPLAYVRQRVRRGSWPATIRIAAVGSTDWRPLDADILGTAADVAPATPAAADAADTVAAKIARVAGSLAGQLNQVRTLPPGPAIHAGFWRRCAAYMIDSLVLFVPSMILSLIPFLGLLVNLVGRWLYFALMESSASQATLGKRAMGLIVTDGKGQRIAFGQATGRYFGAAVSTITAYVGYMLAGWTARKQALHDLMADTCVVFDNVRPDQELPTQRPPMPWYGWAVNVLAFVAPVAILAAIALPAYNDYVQRAKVAQIMVDVSAVKLEVSEAIFSGAEQCAEQQPQVANPLIGEITVSGDPPGCLITVTMASTADVPVAARGQAIEWQHAGDGSWTCISTIADKYLPAECRY